MPLQLQPSPPDARNQLFRTLSDSTGKPSRASPTPSLSAFVSRLATAPPRQVYHEQLSGRPAEDYRSIRTALYTLAPNNMANEDDTLPPPLVQTELFELQLPAPPGEGVPVGDPAALSLFEGSFPPPASVPSLALPTPPVASGSNEVLLAPPDDNPYPGFPTRSGFDRQREEYLGSLDQKKKRAKALIDTELYNFVRSTLLHPQDTTFRTAQDRFWARATFTLAKKGDENNSASAAAKVLTSLSAGKADSPPSSLALPAPSEATDADAEPEPVASTSRGKVRAKSRGTRRPGGLAKSAYPVYTPPTQNGDEPQEPIDESQILVMHDGLPVARSEDIYELLIDCHRRVEHGGREKTFKDIRELWAWVPKDLVARFVKVCPICNANSTPGTKWRNKPAAGTRKKRTPAAKTVATPAKGKGKGKGKAKAETEDDEDDTEAAAVVAEEAEEELDEAKGKGRADAGGMRPRGKGKEKAQEQSQGYVTESDAEGEDDHGFGDEDAEGEDEFVPTGDAASAPKQDGAGSAPPGGTRRSTRAHPSGNVSVSDASANISRGSAATLFDSPNKTKAASPPTSPEASGYRRPSNQMVNAHLFLPGATLPPAQQNGVTAPRAASSAPVPPRPSSSSSTAHLAHLPPGASSSSAAPVYTPYQPFATCTLRANPTHSYPSAIPFLQQPVQYPTFPTSFPSTSDINGSTPYAAAQQPAQPTAYQPYPFPFTQQQQQQQPYASQQFYNDGRSGGLGFVSGEGSGAESGTSLMDVIRLAAQAEEANPSADSWALPPAPLPLPPQKSQQLLPTQPQQQFSHALSPNLNGSVPYGPPGASLPASLSTTSPSLHDSPFDNIVPLPLPLPLPATASPAVPNPPVFPGPPSASPSTSTVALLPPPAAPFAGADALASATMPPPHQSSQAGRPGRDEPPAKRVKLDGAQ
ncbi:hypothetical protein JCM8547_001768 [Rhodosporidiobolus lusitaniae]